MDNMTSQFCCCTSSITNNRDTGWTSADRRNWCTSKGLFTTSEHFDDILSKALDLNELRDIECEILRLWLLIFYSVVMFMCGC